MDVNWEILKRTGGPEDLRGIIVYTLKSFGNYKMDITRKSFEKLYEKLETFSHGHQKNPIKIGPPSSSSLLRGSISYPTPNKTMRLIVYIYMLFVTFVSSEYLSEDGNISKFQINTNNIIESYLSRGTVPHRNDISLIELFDVPTPLLLMAPPSTKNDKNSLVSMEMTNTPYVKRNSYDGHRLQSYKNPKENGFMEDFLNNSDKILDSENYAIYLHSESVKDERQILEMSMWIEYIMSSVSSIYSPSSASKLTVLMTDKTPNVVGKRGGMSVGGIYIGYMDSIMWKMDSVWKDGHIQIIDRINSLKTLVHEMSHRVHLFKDDIITDCGEDICSSRLDFVMTPETKKFILDKKDEVVGIVYLGLTSDEMTQEQARMYLKLILDMRIEEAYSSASVDPVYSTWRWSAYGFTNHREFWAEASVSFLFSISEYNFPSRDWIRENDPNLYSILSEVYSNSLPYIKPEFVSHSGKQFPDLDDP